MNWLTNLTQKVPFIACKAINENKPIDVGK